MKSLLIFFLIIIIGLSSALDAKKELNCYKCTDCPKIEESKFVKCDDTNLDNIPNPQSGGDPDETDGIKCVTVIATGLIPKPQEQDLEMDQEMDSVSNSTTSTDDPELKEADSGINSNITGNFSLEGESSLDLDPPIKNPTLSNGKFHRGCVYAKRTGCTLTIDKTASPPTSIETCYCDTDKCNDQEKAVAALKCYDCDFGCEKVEDGIAETVECPRPDPGKKSVCVKAENGKYPIRGCGELNEEQKVECDNDINKCYCNTDRCNGSYGLQASILSSIGLAAVCLVAFFNLL